MSIGLDDLDSTVAKAFMECLHAVPSSRPSEPVATGTGNAAMDDFKEGNKNNEESSRRSTEQPKEKREDNKRLLSTLVKHRWRRASGWSFVPVGAGFACVMGGAQLESQPWLMGGLFGLSFLFTGTGFWQTFHRDLMVGFRAHLPSDVLLAARPLMNLSPTEHLYTETVALLLALQEKVEERTAGNILSRLNELLTNNRHLEMQRQGLIEAVDQYGITVLEMEHARFIQELSETVDTVTQQSLQQSLQMCETRLQDTRTMEQNLQRVKVQQETIQQTIISVQSALIRIQTTPSLASPAVEELTHVVTQLHQQTQAVEAAVQEVVSMSSQC